MKKYFIEIHESYYPHRVKHWWRVMHANGQVILTSETYANKSSVRRAARWWGKAMGLEVSEVEGGKRKD